MLFRSSTQAGIARALERGAQMILKTRTDIAILAGDVFEQAAWWLRAVGHDAARAGGLVERLIVPSSFTRKYLLYHPSDLVMLGTANDMARYWAAPLDTREGTLLSPERRRQPLAAVNLDGNPAECYLGLHFCESLGRTVEGTLADSWAFYRDLFAVVDNRWFDLLWLKNLSIPDAATTSGPRQLLSQHDWQALAAGGDLRATESGAVSPDEVTLGAIGGGWC